MSVRARALDELRPFVRSDINRVLLERYVFMHTRDETEYLQLAVDVVGQLLLTRSVQEVLKWITTRHVKQRETMAGASADYIWHHAVFDTDRAQEHEEILFQTNPFEVAEGVLQCGKCKSFRTYSFQRQTRSADEPATLYVTCAECGNKWRN